MSRIIREARQTDVAEIMQVMDAAKKIMRQSGNMHQWGEGYPDAHGIFSSIMEFCFSNDENIRIDTHHDNKIMQHNILKHGFTYCGIIYLLSGDERLAYQKIVI
jgi:hypothetical protein